MAKKPFSIDDAFDENLDDVVVRVYGSTTIENKPSVNGGRSGSNLNKALPNESSVAGIPNNNPVLLSIRTGIMQDDVSCFLYMPKIVKLTGFASVCRPPPRTVIL